MASPLCTTWADVEKHILRPLQTRPLSAATVSEPLTCEGLRQYQNQVQSLVASYGKGEDGVLNTLRYMFQHMRCGILVSIRAGGLFLFCPFANVRYQNTWHHKLVFSGGSEDLYVAEKSRLTRKRPEPWIPRLQWWMNGGILCNVMPDDVWGKSHQAELIDMLTSTCKNHVIPDCDFFINKRDFPHMKLSRTDPYTAFTGDTDLKREKYSHYAPILSFYTGQQFADVPIPLTEDWKLVTSPFPAEDNWESTAQVAVFRGSATGYGIQPESNTRIALVLWAREHEDLVDAKFVSYNYRDKAVYADEATIVVDFLRPATLGLPALSAWMPLPAQTAAFRYLLYVDGHCASNRYGALMMAGRVILKVQSTGEANMQWLFYDLVPASVDSGDATVPCDADHFNILPDFSNLEATITYLRSHDDVAKKVAMNARAKAPSTEKITGAMAMALSEIGKLQTDLETCPGKIWFSPYDARYSQLGRLDDSLRFVSLTI